MGEFPTEGTLGKDLPLDESTALLGLPTEAVASDQGKTLPRGTITYEQVLRSCFLGKAQRLKQESFSKDEAHNKNIEANDIKEIIRELRKSNLRKLFHRVGRKIGYSNWTTLRYDCYDLTASTPMNVSPLRQKIKSGYSSRWKEAVRAAYGASPTIVQARQENRTAALSHTNVTTTRDRSDSIELRIHDSIEEAQQCCNEALEEVFNCQKMNHFKLLFHTGKIRSIFVRMDEAMGHDEAEPWSDKWAWSLYQNALEALILDLYRKVLVQFLCFLCVVWKKKEQPISDEEMKGERFMVTELFRLCLPMTRSRFLIAKSKTTGGAGMDWVAEKHKQEERWETLLGQETRPATISERWYNFLDFKELGLKSNPDFERWLAPELAANKATNQGA